VAGGGGTYGHASVTLGRLMKIEAGQHGVEVNLHDIKKWGRQTKTLIGAYIDGDAVKVLRPQNKSTIKHVVSRAIGEVGRKYALPDEMIKSTNLSEREKDFLTRRYGSARLSKRADLEGRYCSEVAAILLGMETVDVTPDQLASMPGFTEVKGAIRAESDWIVLEEVPEIEQANTALKRLGKPITETWRDVVRRTERLKPNVSSKDKEDLAVELESVMDHRIREAVGAIHEVLKTQKVIFPTTSPRGKTQGDVVGT